MVSANKKAGPFTLLSLCKNNFWESCHLQEEILFGKLSVSTLGCAVVRTKSNSVTY